MPDSPNLSPLTEIIARHAPTDGIHPMALGSLDLVRVSTPHVRIHTVQEPALCVIVQGSKRVTLGAETYDYDADRYLLVSLDLPLTGETIEASSHRPYLAFRLGLDAATIAELSASYSSPDLAPPLGRGIGVSALDADLRGPLERLLGLLDTPEHAAALAPLIEREILYRLLIGPQGDRLREIATGWGGAHRIARAIEILRRDYARSLRVADLAREVGMSVSGFHHHFQIATAMSPGQFQKRLRLQEARRLMLSEGYAAGGAAYRVGYESPSHFSRDYRRMFGLPPARDVAEWRGDPAVEF